MQRYVEWIIRHRFIVIGLTLLFTAFAILQIRSLKIAIDPNKLMPQTHPYVSTSTEVENIFGSRYVVVIGITPKSGDIYQTPVLQKVERLTTALLNAPGVVKNNLLSLSAKRVEDIQGNSNGLSVQRLMASAPTTQKQLAQLRLAIARNPVYKNLLISPDGRTTSILVELKDSPNGFREMMAKIYPVIDQERDATVDIRVGGLPVFIDHLEKFSARMAFFFPISLCILSLVLFEAFRTKQGLILPLVTALLAVIWGVGVMGASDIPMDVFNATTPILILAVSTGHAVQLLKRYYEEYYHLRETTHMTPKEANHQAIVTSISKVGPVMIAAGTVAALGFFSLMIFEIKMVRTFGIFTGVGILAAMTLEMTFIPALRALLAPPKDRPSALRRNDRVWEIITGKFADLVTGEFRSRVFLGLLVFVVLAVLGITRLVNNNSVKNSFAPNLVFEQDDRFLNQSLGGTNTMYLLIEGKDNDAIKDPKTLQAMDELQQMLDQEKNVGKTYSIVDFIKRMNQAMHGDDAKQYRVPDSRDLIAQYLLLYSMSGDPGDFDAFVDYGYKKAKLTVLLKTDSTAYIESLIKKVKAFSDNHFPVSVKVRIGGSVPGDDALDETMVKVKLLNILQIAAVVLIISSLIFRSVVAGIMVLLPLLIVVVTNFGLMGWSGIPLNIPTSLTSAMAIGIGADYAIYLIFRLREELAIGHDENQAVRKALRSSGEAILFVAVAVACGYGVLLFSFGFYIHMWLAILIGAAMLVGATSALILIPLLTLSFRPKFIFGKANFAHETVPPILTILIVMLGAGIYHGTSYAADFDLDSIMERNHSVSLVIDSKAEATFSLINESGQVRVRKVLDTTKLENNKMDNMRMTRFIWPPDVKGTASLLIEHGDTADDIWIYLPALKKVRRLVSSNKKDSFIGTDFSYADVIGYKVKEWNYKLLKEDMVDNRPCYVIEATPTNDTVEADTGYSKRVIWIRKDNKVTVKTDYWDEHGQPLKTIIFSDIKQVDPKLDKWQAMRMEATNIQTKHKTIIQLDNFKVNQQFRAEDFTASRLEKE
jgi:hypothetical protein